MIDKIEVYVRIGKVISGQYTSEPISDGVIKHDCLSKSVLEYESTMSETDKEALRVVNEFAGKEGLRVEVHDVSTFMGRLMAALVGIDRTPVVVFGKNRFEGELKPEQLARARPAFHTEWVNFHVVLNFP